MMAEALAETASASTRSVRSMVRRMGPARSRDMEPTRSPVLSQDSARERGAIDCITRQRSATFMGGSYCLGLAPDRYHRVMVVRRAAHAKVNLALAVGPPGA